MSTATRPDAELDELRDLAVEAAVSAGAMVLAGRLGGDVTSQTKSTDTDMVTQYDRASESMIVELIGGRRPQDGIVGEEGSHRPGTSGIEWLIDPIDGTTNFLYALPGYAVSIAAGDASGALVGVVNVPARDELFVAVRGRGATLNGAALRCSSTDSVGRALVATGFGYRPERRVEQATRVARLIGGIRDIRRLGAASVDLCYTAAGRYDAYFEDGLGPWDLAAGLLVAHEAGCLSGDFGTGPARPGEVLVAAPGVFAGLRSLISAAGSG